MQPFAPIHNKPPKHLLEASSHKLLSPPRLKPGMIQIVGTQDHIILQKGNECLWCAKESGTLKASTGERKRETVSWGYLLLRSMYSVFCLL